jgi:hypothetical protein
MSSRFVVVAVAVSLSGCAFSEKEMVKIKARHRSELDSAVQSGDPEKLVALCRTPLLAHANFRRPWYDTETSAEACQLIKNRFDAATASAITEAKKAGGAECLHRLQGRFEAGRNMKPESFAWQKEDALRAALAPAAEACTAELEALHAEGSWRAVYSAMLGNEQVAEGTAFDPAVQARLKKLWADAPKGALTEFETAASNAGSPLAQSMFLAAAACAAKSVGNQGRTRGHTHKAQELVLGASANTVKVTLHGPPAVVDAVQKAGAGSSVVFAEGGELAFEVTPGAPSFKTGRETLSRTAERQVPGGSKPNPEYRHVKEDCERIERYLERERDSCNRNGPRNTNCGRIASRQKEVASCHKKLTGIREMVPATRTETASYDELRIYGDASGSVTLKNLKATPEPTTSELRVSATVSHFEHGSVPGFTVGATGRATPVTEGELRGAYDQQLASVVAAAIREHSSQLFGRLLVTAAQSTSDEERAAAYLRYRVVSNKRLDDHSHVELTRRMALPTRQAMDMLTAK